MDYLIIDAHIHLWEKLKGCVNEQPVKHLGGGLALFLGEEKQMMPPYMVDGKNSAEIFIANMNYAGVAGAVVTQEYIDGDQNSYLLDVENKYPERFLVCGLAEFRKSGYLQQTKELIDAGFSAIKIPAQRLVDLKQRVYLTDREMMASFALMEERNIIVSIDLAEGEQQVAEMDEVIQEFPNLKVAIGHFGMINRKGWQKQVALARYPNVMIESGGITWLYHNEFYPYKGAIKGIKEAADLVGMDKLMWGSDYPRTMTAITYKMSFDFILKTKELSEEQKEMFLGKNAESFYRFSSLQPIKIIKNMVED